MKIIVETEELKQEILKQSEYIHDFLINKDDVKNLGDWVIGLDSDKAGILMHLYMTPQIIEVEQQKVMNKEQQELLNEAYKNYFIKKSSETGPFGIAGIIPTKEEFIYDCKTDPEFSEKWGLTIEERELSLEERYNMWFNNNYETGLERFFDPNKLPDFDDPYYEPTPTKLITISYNDKTIESYE